MGIKIAKVYVDKIVYHVDKPFDYIVPFDMTDKIMIGCRVLIPFGSSNKKVCGIVLDIEDRQEVNNPIKPIFALIDEAPIVDNEMINIVEFLVKKTFCTHYDAIKTITPLGSGIDVFCGYEFCREFDIDKDYGLSDNEKNVIQFLLVAKTPKEFNSILNSNNNTKKQIIKSLLLKGIIREVNFSKSKVSTPTVKMVKISNDFDIEGIKLTKKQNDVLNLLKNNNSMTVKELCYLAGVSIGVIKNLCSKHILDSFEEEISINHSTAVLSKNNNLNIELSDVQHDVFLGILKKLQEKKPNVSLLFGVTGSGKTLIYMKLIEYVIEQGETAMLLVPEIALTSQLLQKFILYFGDIVGVIHSNLSIKERFTVFNNIKSGKTKIVLGTRSSIFSPLQNIGVIILDEEGESSYKSDSSPRYHTRDIAKLRCAFNNSSLILGSATPSIESYYKAKSNKYSFFSINERFGESKIPDVFLVDMKKEYDEKNFSSLSRILVDEINKNLLNNEQSIILLNRRGYNTYATCMECGDVIKCENCDVAMTYHKVNLKLVCHYCGASEEFVSKCKSCNCEYIKLTGIGTQKIEDEIANIFPKARLLRMDTDSTYSKHAYEQKFTEFYDNKYDIMVGTQMIAKGLNFPNVTLVGVINSDTLLYSGDYKSSERVFSLITQVIGRSGRSDKNGRAYIQTFDTDNPVISLAATQNYEGFYQDEIVTRKAMLYPPFCDIIVFGFSGKKENDVIHASHYAANLLKQMLLNQKNIALKIIGVTPASIYKISNKYRYRLIVKCKLNKELTTIIEKFLKELGIKKDFIGISIYADVNGDISG